MALTVTAAPETEPLTAAEAKAQLRVDGTDDDTLISALITVAREHVETILGRRLITQTLVWTLDDFPCGRRLQFPTGPVQSVGSVKYYASAVLTTWSASLYELSTGGESLPARLGPVDGATWPTVDVRLDGVEITFIAGYSDADAVPQAIKQAMKLMIGDWYAFREQVVAGSVGELPVGSTARALLMPYRLWV